MNREEQSDPGNDEASSGDSSASDKKPHGNWAVVKRAIQTWWYHHPANVALSLARPLIGRYAGDHPVQLLALASAVGALAVLAKPWRVVSLGGLLLSTVKSANVTSILLSMLSSSSVNSNNQDTRDNRVETP